ncbi:phosphatases II, partial [Anaeromyces robustus]
PVKILPNLYLGSCDATKELSTLLDKDITTILNLAAEVEKPKCTPFVDSYSYALPPETPFMDTVSTLPETPYVDTFSTPITKLEIHYYHQCWNHNQKNTQEKILQAFNIIDSTRLEDQHSILVSCQQGVSRSATLVIAYVMKTKQWGLMKSYNFVKEKCPWIAPNISLMNELSEFEQHL